MFTAAPNDVLLRDELDLVALAAELFAQRRIELRIALRDRAPKENVVRTKGGTRALQGHRSSGAGRTGSAGYESLATRRAWRPPSNWVARNMRRQSLATSVPRMRAPSASTL